MAALTMCFGVLKSGWPIPKFIMSLPFSSSFLALPSISKALSVPRRNCFSAIFKSFLYQSSDWPSHPFIGLAECAQRVSVKTD